MREKIKSLLKQAELYRSQGLFNEARESYERVRRIIQKSKQLPNRDKLLDNVSKKIAKVQGVLVRLENASSSPQMSPEVNRLIKKLFSQTASEDKDAAALEGAVALAKFGQFNDAIAEFRRLLDVDSQRVQAAKNILRCLITYKSSDDAYAQLSEWKVENIFSEDELEKVKSFFEEILDKKWDEKGAARSEALTGGGVDEDDFLDISAVAITLPNGNQVELDVSFQSGNVVSLIIDRKDEKMIQDLQEGSKLEDVHFYSPIAIFRGSGEVTSKTKITSGPKQGDYSMDIKIDSL
ncbi:tetratricopeptide repeat protein [Desulfosudis oleivorans]|uniref:Tetratricopeptide repeat protein n=1 Tax=Desulfosudis oleivorans (strain DSM 6200 / JCM 39069 / Hxd3) TaxID=96561 RepID=A8ZVJ0_DESOH|nr:hypothetical protein [Desulfosudis oleivorans]ABW68177.1 hypothetical protein Dole_2373 [Desulfosudis oleivorans Hxd3]